MLPLPLCRLLHWDELVPLSKVLIFSTAEILILRWREMKSKCDIFVSFLAFHSVCLSQFFVEIISGFSQAAYTHITPNHLLFTSAFQREPGSEDFYTSPSCMFTRYSLDVRRCALRIITKRLSCIFFVYSHWQTQPRQSQHLCAFGCICQTAISQEPTTHSMYKSRDPMRCPRCMNLTSRDFNVTSPCKTNDAFSGWSSYPFLTSNLPSTLCTFYPYEDFSQIQPRRVSVSVFDTSTPGFALLYALFLLCSVVGRLTHFVRSREFTFSLRFTCVHPDWDNNMSVGVFFTFSNWHVVALMLQQLHCSTGWREQL